MDYVSNGGGDCSKVKIKFNGQHDRVLLAACNIEVGETLLCIPKKLLILAEDSFNTPIGKQMKEKDLTDTKKVKFAMSNFLAVILL